MGDNSFTGALRTRPLLYALGVQVTVEAGRAQRVAMVTDHRLFVVGCIGGKITLTRLPAYICVTIDLTATLASDTLLLLCMSKNTHKIPLICLFLSSQTLLSDGL